MKILCIGKSGQVASALAERAEEGDMHLECVGRPDFDFLKAGHIARIVDKYEPTIIVNAAAFTAVDAAESNEDDAFALNARAPGELAELCARNSVPLIQISTDYVFDGHSNRPYQESDPTNPLSAYGRTKLAGEVAVSNALKQHIILRTSWVYGPHNHNFITTMLRLAMERGGASVVDDQIGTPTSAIGIADAILTIANYVNSQRDGDIWGTFHLTAAGECSWADFAELVFAIYDRKTHSNTALSRIPTTDYPTPAERPKNSRLSTQKITGTFGVKPRPWREEVEETVQRLLLEADSTAQTS